MNKRHVLIGLLFLLLLGPVGSSHAALIFSENFNNAIGTLPLLDPRDQPVSEKWGLTNYYIGSPAVATGWTFAGQAYVAENGTNTTDKAILLNESPHGSMSTSINVSQGTTYLLTFDHWGDNRPGAPGYQFSVSINGSVLDTISRIYPESGPGVTESIYFTAASNNIVLSFLDSSSGQASAIIDNVNISSVPIPPTVWLLGSSLVGLVGLRRRFRKL